VAEYSQPNFSDFDDEDEWKVGDADRPLKPPVKMWQEETKKNLPSLNANKESPGAKSAFNATLIEKTKEHGKFLKPNAIHGRQLSQREG
jgi:hypothetical protein